MHVLCSQMASGGLATALNPCFMHYGAIVAEVLAPCLGGVWLNPDSGWGAVASASAHIIISTFAFLRATRRATALESASDSWGDVPPNDSLMNVSNFEDTCCHCCLFMVCACACLRLCRHAGGAETLHVFAVVEKPF